MFDRYGFSWVTMDEGTPAISRVRVYTYEFIQQYFDPNPLTLYQFKHTTGEPLIKDPSEKGQALIKAAIPSVIVAHFEPLYNRLNNSEAQIILNRTLS